MDRYLKRTDPLEVKIFGDKMIDLDIDLWVADHNNNSIIEYIKENDN